MNGIIFGVVCTLAVVLPSYAQFFDAGDCAAGRALLDPFLLQALKSKYPKKYNAKLDMAKDLALDAKYKLGAAKILARHLKNMNSINYDLQNLMYQQQQAGLMQPMVAPDQSALLAQQQQLSNIQIPFDASRSLGLAQQPDPQMTCFQQIPDPRLQQQAFQLTGTQSKPCTSLPCQCASYEESCGCGCEDGVAPRSDALSSVLAGFLGIMKNIIK